MWLIWDRFDSIFFKSPLTMNCTGCPDQFSISTHSWRLTVNTTLKISQLYDDSRQGWKRSIDNLGMPGNFKYITVHATELMKDDEWQQTRKRWRKAAKPNQVVGSKSTRWQSKIHEPWRNDKSDDFTFHANEDNYSGDQVQEEVKA